MEMAKKRTMNDYCNSDAYTVLCEPYKKEVAGVLGVDSDKSRIHAIENPERPVDDVCWEKDNVILFCGRFENWSKRVDRLLRIWSVIQDRLPDWKLELVGNGPAEGMLRRMAEELKLERVSFEGRKADVESYYRRASVVVLTSETEGWPLALSEGQAHGCIGVAFGATAGITEILSPDGECGFIVPPFDEEAFADTLLKIALMSDDEKMKIRRNSVAKRRKYHPEFIAAKWKIMFDSLNA
jgi:glycosyltransferase involved in cell wall biosynthesis